MIQWLIRIGYDVQAHCKTRGFRASVVLLFSALPTAQTRAGPTDGKLHEYDSHRCSSYGENESTFTMYVQADQNSLPLQ